MTVTKQVDVLVPDTTAQEVLAEYRQKCVEALALAGCDMATMRSYNRVYPAERDATLHVWLADMPIRQELK